MARDRTASSGAKDERTAAGLAVARDHQRDLLCDAFWLPLAAYSRRLAAMEHGLSQVRGLVRRLGIEAMVRAVAA